MRASGWRVHGSNGSQDHYGLLILDLDRFKAINDERGHLAGDEVLRAASDALRRVLRVGDSAYRYGGEEFVALILLTRPSEALAAAERIRAAIEIAADPQRGNAPYGHLTTSVGVTTIGPADLFADDASWLARADAALYRAKTNGRNRAEAARATRLPTEWVAGARQPMAGVVARGRSFRGPPPTRFRLDPRGRPGCGAADDQPAGGSTASAAAARSRSIGCQRVDPCRGLDRRVDGSGPGLRSALPGWRSGSRPSSPWRCRRSRSLADRRPCSSTTSRSLSP